MDIKDYIVITIMAAVWIIAEILKKPVFEKFNIKDYIPLFCAVLGVLFNSWLNGWQFDFSIFLNGLASGFAATGLNEGIDAVFKNQNRGKIE